MTAPDPVMAALAHRVSSEWYYPWDCASGCIWDLSAVRVKAEVVAS